jgi:pectinesterase
MRRKKSNRMACVVLLMAFITSIMSAQTFTEEISAIADIIVDIKGSGDYTSVQEGINAIPDSNDIWKIIFVKKGIYYEKVILGYKKTNVILVGEDVDSTIISYNENAQIYNDTLGNGHTFSTYTFRADAHDFQAYNISFRNNAEETGATGDAQAVAFHSNGDRQILYHCRILGRQDTYFDGFRTRRFMKDCFIEGTTDFIFGFGVTLFDSCQIHSLGADPMTAASTPEHYEFGQVFRHCRLTAAPGINGTQLGRPWFDWANTIFYECWEPASIIPGGWSPWSGRQATCIYQEYNCLGPGSDTLNRVEFGKQLDPSKASRYVIDTIFAASNFPSDLGYDADTNEFMHVRRRFEASGYPERADTIIYAGRDTFPTYPTDNWSPELYSPVFELVNEYDIPFMDSANGEISIDNIYWNDNPIPDFNSDTLQYVVELDNTITVVPVLSIEGQGVSASYSYPESLPGKATINALSRDKVNGYKYSVYFSQDSAYWETELKQVIINGIDTLQIEPGVYDYDVVLQEGASRVRLVIVTKVPGQTYSRNYPDDYPGVATIDVTAPNGETTRTYNLNISLFVGLSEMRDNPSDIHVINPVVNSLQFYNRGDQILNTEIKVFDLNGRTLFSEKRTSLTHGINETGINISGLDNGIYVYNIRAESRSFSGKFIIAN